ncbi:barstar family protein [Streptomyces sp. NPDC020983]|uniref:barstar family protein n=1 Tax=Streptomyces sp. NPDC020983 TaxID=3365106 RepID=UPI0037A11BBA
MPCCGAGWSAVTRDGETVVDLRGRPVETLNGFWDAVSEPCRPPERFGRNLDAWSDTIATGGISEVIDSHGSLIAHVDHRGLFSGDRREGRVPAGIFDGERKRLVGVVSWPAAASTRRPRAGWTFSGRLGQQRGAAGGSRWIRYRSGGGGGCPAGRSGPVAASGAMAAYAG